MASLGDLDWRMHEERWGDSFEGGSGTYLGRRKWTDSSHSLTQQVNHSLFVRSSEGGEVVGRFVSISLSRLRRNGTFVLEMSLS